MGQLHPVTHKHITPLYHESMPPNFCGPAGWVQLTCNAIIKGCNQQDDSSNRVPPIGFVRHAHGGKSRAFHEIEQYLREHHPDIVVINIMFCNYSSVDFNEEADPVGALCHRICFWFLKDRTKPEEFEQQYSKMKQYKVNSDAILKFIGDQPCILLIDQLNSFDAARTTTLVQFLMYNFLLRRGRFFAF
jgi:hypothetical protein